MSLVPKTATIQVRVVPTVKSTSEQVLRRIGLTMSEAVELFLRRIIVDERIPFEIVALSQFQISGFTGDRPYGHPLTGRMNDLLAEKNQLKPKLPKKGERSKKKKLKKIFLANRTPSKIRTKTRSENGETGQN